MQRGLATFTLDYGKCPAWLFERMKKLGREMCRVIVEEYGPEEFIKRLSDPVWFQSLGTVLAFDWNASGLTTILTAALKEALRGEEEKLGIFICGGKGKTSRKTPEQIQNWGQSLSLRPNQVSNLVYNSKMAAKVDSSLVQDGFQIYHHSFFFTRKGAWTVVQQGMNIGTQTARRYHWFSENIKDLVCEPHSGISSELKVATLNLVAQQSHDTRQISTDLVQNGYSTLMKDIELLRRNSSELHKMARLRLNSEAGLQNSPKSSFKELTLLALENKEFVWHPVVIEDFSKSRYLEKILAKICEKKPENYENLLAQEGVGPKTIRALALVSEVIYGAVPSYEDPARYSFAHGGKDATPYPVDRKTYDQTIETMKKVVAKTKIDLFEKRKILKRLNSFADKDN
jgi:hypothetical protein